MKTIVLTGLIGSGKSLCCRILEKHGIPTYDSDSAVKALYETHPELKKMVKKDIFSRAEELKKLEDAVYPVLLGDFEKWKLKMETEGCWSVCFESAILLEKEAFDNFGDYIILIDAPQQIRIERAVSRGTVDEDSVRLRNSLQKDQIDNPRVNFVVRNTGTEEQLEKQLIEILKEIKENGK